MPALELYDLFHVSPEAGAVLRGSPLARIDALALQIGRTAPEVRAAAEEIRGLTAEVRASVPNREEILEAIERVCGDDLSGACASRIAEAVARALRDR